VATDTLVHNQILDARCAILTSPDPGGFAAGIVSALTDGGLVERTAAAAAGLLETSYHPDRRGESYRRLLALAQAARGTA